MPTADTNSHLILGKRYGTSEVKVFDVISSQCQGGYGTKQSSLFLPMAVTPITLTCCGTSSDS